MKTAKIFFLLALMNNYFYIALSLISLFSCSKSSDFYQSNYELVNDYNTPDSLVKKLGPIKEPANNPTTIYGVALGRKLFYEKKLSGDGTQSCASCHIPSRAFSDKDKFSIGITGAVGQITAPPLFNLGYGNKFFWNGRVNSLEKQAILPVTNPIEMNASWKSVIETLKSDEEYMGLFEKAFNTRNIDSSHVAKAIAQFERTIYSVGSPFDTKGLNGLTEQEQRGYQLFMSEKGDCFHCHPDPLSNPLLTDNLFHNNGLDINPDSGLAQVTFNENDIGKFKTPSLRNLAFTPPYMHDGRFETLEEVLDFYSEGLKDSPTVDPLMKNVFQGGNQLTPEQKADIISFLLAFTDSAFVLNSNYLEP